MKSIITIIILSLLLLVTTVKAQMYEITVTTMTEHGTSPAMSALVNVEGYIKFLDSRIEIAMIRGDYLVSKYLFDVSSIRFDHKNNVLVYTAKDAYDARNVIIYLSKDTDINGVVLVAYKDFDFYLFTKAVD